MNLRDPMTVLHFFSIKYTFYDKMNIYIYIYSPLVLTSETKMVPEDQKVNILLRDMFWLFAIYCTFTEEF